MGRENIDLEKFSSRVLKMIKKPIDKYQAISKSPMHKFKKALGWTMLGGAGTGLAVSKLKEDPEEKMMSMIRSKQR